MSASGQSRQGSERAYLVRSTPIAFDARTSSIGSFVPKADIRRAAQLIEVLPDTVITQLPAAVPNNQWRCGESSCGRALRVSPPSSIHFFADWAPRSLSCVAAEKPNGETASV